MYLTNLLNLCTSKGWRHMMEQFGLAANGAGAAADMSTPAVIGTMGGQDMPTFAATGNTQAVATDGTEGAGIDRKFAVGGLQLAVLNI